MNYLDRQNSVIWTSPSGKRFELLTDGKIKFSRKRKGEVKNNPTRTVGKKNNKTSYKTVNMSDDTFQDMGVSGREFGLKIYFIGDNHDIEADEFDAAYCERGLGKIQLPYKGVMNVQALDIDYDVDTVEKSSLTVVNIKFHECGLTKYPEAKISAASAASKNILEAADITAQNFGDTVSSLADKETFAEKWASNLDKLSQKLGDIQDSVFVSILNDIKIQNILNNPYVMATQVGILLKKGLRAYRSIYETLSMADDLLSDFLPSSSLNGSRGSFDDVSVLKSEYTADDLFAKQTIISACEVLNNTEFEIRKDAVFAIDTIQEINDDYIEKSQNIETVLNESLEYTVINDVDITGIVNNTAGVISDKIGDLRIEKTVYLKEFSNPLLLAWKYYPDLFNSYPDEAIEYLNKTNGFSGDDFVFLEKGRRVTVYV